VIQGRIGTEYENSQLNSPYPGESTLAGAKQKQSIQN
jgi:hypothetical protein